MIKTAPIFASLVLAAGAVAVAPAGFGEESPEAAGSIYAPDYEVRDFEGTPYISGGVGEIARDVLEQQAQDFNLKLVFASQSGHYLADVNVLIQSRDGEEILRAVADGPWLYTQLPPGTYTVTAEAAGDVKRQTVRVGGKGRRQVSFYWPDRLALPGESQSR
jgi:hypothetical protein